LPKTASSRQSMPEFVKTSLQALSKLKMLAKKLAFTSRSLQAVGRRNTATIRNSLDSSREIQCGTCCKAP